MTTIRYEAGRVVEATVDHGDGTGTRTVYDAAGKATGTEQVTLPQPDPAEKAARSIEDRLRAAFTANAAYLAVETPTAAQQRAQTARLTRQTQALIRTLLRDLTDTTDT